MQVRGMDRMLGLPGQASSSSVVGGEEMGMGAVCGTAEEFWCGGEGSGHD